MPRLRYLPSARDDLTAILKNVGRQAGSVAVGERAVRSLRRRCSELADLPGTMGRSRPSLSADVRTVSEGNFVIFSRYRSGHLEVLNVLDGRRDIESLFEDRQDLQ